MYRYLDFKISVVFVLLIVIGSTNANAEKGVKDDKRQQSSSNQLLVDGLNSTNDLTIQDLAYLSKIGIIDAGFSKKQKRILRIIKSKVSKRSKTEIVNETEDSIEIDIYNENNQSKRWLNVKYFFKEKKLIRGPVFEKYN